MRSFIGLTAVACVVMLATAGVGKAQLVAITTANYVAPPPNPKADPQGTWSVGATADAWRVQFRYGTVTGGVFTEDLTIGQGGTVNLIVPKIGGNGTWGPIGQETLQKNPLPANTYVRALLQKSVMGGAYTTQATAVYPVN